MTGSPDPDKVESLREDLYGLLIEGCSFNCYGECQTHRDERNYAPGGHDVLVCSQVRDVVEKVVDLVVETVESLLAD